MTDPSTAPSADVTRSEALDQRERELDAREHELDLRKAALDAIEPIARAQIADMQQLVLAVFANSRLKHERTVKHDLVLPGVPGGCGQQHPTPSTTTPSRTTITETSES